MRFREGITVTPGDGCRRLPATLLAALYPVVPARMRGGFLRVISRIEGGQMSSLTLRHLMRKFHGVEVGLHSYGCFDTRRLGGLLLVGRYVSVGPGVRAFRRNHPHDRASMHPYFYNTALGIAEHETVPPHPLVISDDAWIGANTIILPGYRRIGRGAVIGAGSVVTRDIPDYAIAAGNPARVLRFRFVGTTQEAVEKSRWWELPRHALAGMTVSLQSPLTEENCTQFLESIANAREH
jgi:acetyltransferase-like isoleucine patch superfamily enzyme